MNEELSVVDSVPAHFTFMLPSVQHEWLQWKGIGGVTVG